MVRQFPITLSHEHLDRMLYGMLYMHLLLFLGQSASGQSFFVYNNFDDSLVPLEDGVYGLSNASLNSPWPKIATGRDALARYCQHANVLDTEHLFELLKNNAPADDAALPKTGVPIEWERRLSSIFIRSDDYGTRSSTVLLVDHDKHVTWEERTFNPQAEQESVQHFEFDIKSS